MKQKFHFCAIFFFMVFVFLLASEQLAARMLSVKRGGVEVEKLDVVGDEDPLPKIENTDSVNELMGLEGCGNGDTECFDRRDLAEAHLDYIYTQHQKP